MLKESQVLLIEDHLRSRGFLYQPVVDDLLDHVCMATASKMRDGTPFADAFEGVKADFGKDGLERIYLETIKNLSPLTMYRNYITSAWRNLIRRMNYTSISILGLVLGISIFLTVSVYTSDELSYDTFHPDNVYRISANIHTNGQVYNEATCQFPLAETLEAQVSGIVSSVRIHKPYSPTLLRYEDIKYTEPSFYYVDETFFDVFGYRLIRGNPEEALSDPNSIVISEKAALRYFGDKDPMGKIIQMETSEGGVPLKVTGIVENRNQESHFPFDVLVPLDQMLDWFLESYDGGGPAQGWFWTGAWTYVRLQDETTADQLTAALPAFVKQHFPDAWKEDSELELMPIEQIHLHSNKLAEMQPNGSLTQVRIFSVIGLVVLLIAVVNFVNLMNAQGISYAKQVGVRKSLGALRLQIVQQYLLEALMLSLISGVLALILVQWLFIPEVNDLAGKSLSLALYATPVNLGLYLLALLLLGSLSGIYPAIVLALLDTLKILKGNQPTGKRGGNLQQAFVIFQFVASVTLIVAVIFINGQNNYIRSMDTGFDRDNILVLKASTEINERLEAFKTEVNQIEGVTAVSGVLDLPGRGTASLRFVPEGRPVDQPELLPLTYADPDLLQVSGIGMAAGRFFDKTVPTDLEQAFVLNEQAAKLFGWTNEEAIGKGMQMYKGGASEIGMRGKVIGVIEDYHFESAYNSVRPLVTIMDPRVDYYLVKFQNTDLSSLTREITEVWANFEPLWPMESFMLDHNLAGLYEKEAKLQKITNYGMAFALLIALVGVYGLSSYLLGRRTKEVGIRRVLGCKRGRLLLILSRNFMLMVLVANLIALPLSYWLMDQWLNDFVYRIPLHWTAFGISAVVSILLAIFAVSYHTIRVSNTSPVKSLRYE